MVMKSSPTARLATVAALGFRARSARRASTRVRGRSGGSSPPPGFGRLRCGGPGAAAARAPASARPGVPLGRLPPGRPAALSTGGDGGGRGLVAFLVRSGGVGRPERHRLVVPGSLRNGAVRLLGGFRCRVGLRGGGPAGAALVRGMSGVGVVLRGRGVGVGGKLRVRVGEGRLGRGEVVALDLLRGLFGAEPRGAVAAGQHVGERVRERVDRPPAADSRSGRSAVTPWPCPPPARARSTGRRPRCPRTPPASWRA